MLHKFSAPSFPHRLGVFKIPACCPRQMQLVYWISSRAESDAALLRTHRTQQMKMKAALHSEASKCGGEHGWSRGGSRGLGGWETGLQPRLSYWQWWDPR